MQPYFFPYSGYFALIAKTDNWVVFDISQYTRKSWITRNRILHPEQGWQYINVPVKKGPQSMRIQDVKIENAGTSRDKLLAQIEHYRKHAPFYNEVRDLVITTFGKLDSDSLVDLNIAGIDTVCRYLNIPFRYTVCSRENFPLPVETHPGGWALEISTLLGASEYINPVGGKDLFRPEEFDKRNIALSFLPAPDFTYRCDPYVFENHLSILDVLMWNEPGKTREMMYSTGTISG